MSNDYNTILIEHAIELADELGDDYIAEVERFVYLSDLHGLARFVDKMYARKMLLEA